MADNLNVKYSCKNDSQKTIKNTLDRMFWSDIAESYNVPVPPFPEISDKGKNLVPMTSSAVMRSLTKFF